MLTNSVSSEVTKDQREREREFTYFHDWTELAFKYLSPFLKKNNNTC